MKFPAHKASMHLTHNDHLSVYETVKDRIERNSWYEDGWVSEEQKAKAIETNELWELQWYPETPVGFCKLFAADLDVLLAAANAA
jgi:hypothetical protein